MTPTTASAEVCNSASSQTLSRHTAAISQKTKTQKTHMKTKLTSIILAGLTTLLASCASGGGAKPYPLKTCIVTDNDLNSMGDEQSIVHQGQVIKFCCEPCVEKFQKNPAKYLAKLP
jgi:hypothetical protein